MKNLFLTDRFFGLLSALTVVFVAAYGLPFLFGLAKVLTLVFAVFFAIDVFILFIKKGKIEGERIVPQKFSNGDDNPIHLNIKNDYDFEVKLTVLDELPPVLQIRDTSWQLSIDSQSKKEIKYDVRPRKRGVYNFGNLVVLVASAIGLVQKRYRFAMEQEVKVYPSFLKLREQELLSFSRRNADHGSKRMRKFGNTTEFEQIKEYVTGDDPRYINWKASAKTSNLMVNQYIDEKAQQVFCLIDKGRLMKMPFEGLSLLDYSINAAVAISNIALKNDDKVGLVTFESKIGGVVPARKKTGHLLSIMEVLHNQRSHFKESNFELLYNYASRKISQRSLLLLFTNFEGRSTLNRQLPYIKSLARKHLVVVVFYKNTELYSLSETSPVLVQDIYTQTIAEQLIFEKELIVKQLKKYGIMSILTSPESLSIDVIKKYLEIKERRML